MKSSISRSAAWLFTTRIENPDEGVAALDGKTEAVIRELEAQHKEARRSLRRRRDRVRGPPTLPREDVPGSHGVARTSQHRQVASVERPRLAFTLPEATSQGIDRMRPT
jgi:hypothetical protein